VLAGVRFGYANINHKNTYTLDSILSFRELCLCFHVIQLSVLVTKYLKKNQLKRRKDLFWFSFRIFSPWFVDSIILEPVTKQSIMARSSWHRKSAHLMVVRKERERRERKRKREEKGANGLQEYIS
jgi:hypothetical protein